MPESSQPSKRVQFEDELKKIHINKTESYLKFLLELKEPNTVAYRKAIQCLYNIIIDINSTPLIIKYQLEEEEKEITESNEAAISLLGKNALLNVRKAISNYL